MPSQRIKITTVYSIDELTEGAKWNAQCQTLGVMVERGALDKAVSWFDLIDHEPEFISDWAVKNGLDFLSTGSIYEE